MILNDLLKSISLISRTTASYMKEIQLFKICCSNSIKEIVKRTRSSDKYILNNHLFGQWKQFLSQKLHALLCPLRSQGRIRTCCSSQQSIMTIQHVKSLYAALRIQNTKESCDAFVICHHLYTDAVGVPTITMV